ncbi:MAG: C-GCAxxG-C-C family protein, partial [Candidatus Cloacimonadota bacterium]|nr:C-GCAxxG-C-C family protein [Candidatus Cloacimonadota bacterium]
MKNKKEQIYDLAKQTYLEYGSCAQAVLITLSKEINHIDESLIRASHTLSGGSGLMGFGMCGALNGGLLAISSKYGRPLD